jgi:hypothetical protein
MTRLTDAYSPACRPRGSPLLAMALQPIMLSGALGRGKRILIIGAGLHQDRVEDNPCVPPLNRLRTLTPWHSLLRRCPVDESKLAKGKVNTDRGRSPPYECAAHAPPRPPVSHVAPRLSSAGPKPRVFLQRRGFPQRVHALALTAITGGSDSVTAQFYEAVSFLKIVAPCLTKYLLSWRATGERLALL